MSRRPRELIAAPKRPRNATLGVKTAASTQMIVREKIQSLDPNVYTTTADPHRILTEAITVGCIAILTFGEYTENETGQPTGNTTRRFEPAAFGNSPVPQDKYVDFPPQLGPVCSEIYKMTAAERAAWKAALLTMCSDWAAKITPAMAFNYIDVYNGMVDILSLRAQGTDVTIFFATTDDDLYVGNVSLIRISETTAIPWGINRALTVISPSSNRACSIEISRVSSSLFTQLISHATSVGLSHLFTWPLDKGGFALKSLGFEEAIGAKRQAIETHLRATRFRHWAEPNKRYPLLSMKLI